MSTLSLRLLGAPAIAVDGTVVMVGHTKALALLAYLAVTDRPHTRDALAGLLWSDREQQRARGEVRRMLWAPDPPQALSRLIRLCERRLAVDPDYEPAHRL